MIRGKANKIAAIFVFAAMLFVYLLTVAPTVSFWDSGEFITCAYTMGVPHPPGSPLLSIIGRVFSLIPFFDFRGNGMESIAYRINLMNVLFGALTVLFIYLLTVRLITKVCPFGESRLRDWAIISSSIFAAFLIGFSNQFWENAVETETYMPSLFLSVLAIWLALRWEERRNERSSLRYLFAASYIIGLGNGIHLYVALAAPVVLMIVVFAKPNWFIDVRLWGSAIFFIVALILINIFAGAAWLFLFMGFLALVVPVLAHYMNKINYLTILLKSMTGLILCVSLFSVGYSVYPTIMVRAAKNPAINQGNPDTFERFKSYLAREQYGQGNMYAGMLERKSSVGYQFGFMYGRYIFQQFPKWGPALNIGFTNDKSADYPGQKVLISESVYFSVLLWLIIGAGLFWHITRDKRRFFPLLTYFILTSVGLVLYLNMENPQARERDYFFIGSFCLLAVWSGMGFFYVINTIGEILSNRDSKMAVPAVVVLICGFATIVPAAAFSKHIDRNYSNFSIHNRSNNFIPLDYAKNILESCQPNAILFTQGDNDTYPLWYAREVENIRRDVSIVNLSILKAPWYIKQLRDGEMKVPIAYSDDFIDNKLCGNTQEAQKTALWSPSPKTVTYAGFTWDMPPDMVFTTSENRQMGLLSVSSIMTVHIIKENKGKRPVNFAGDN